MPPNQDQRQNIALRPALIAAAVSVAVFLAAALPLILSQNLMGRAAFDQLHFHEPVVRQFTAQWPRPDLSDYRSATTPGYHLVLAGVARYLSDSGMILQLAAATFTAALLGLLAWACGRITAAAVWGMLLTLPMAASIYVFFPGVWLLPDNLGWLLVLAMGLWCWRMACGRGAAAVNFAVAAALLIAIVFVRQSHFWTAGLLWLAAWIAAAPIGDGGLMGMLTNLPRRFGGLVFAAVATLPAAAVLVGFARLWEGMTPPLFKGQYPNLVNPATPAFVLALLAVLSAFFAGFVGPAAWRVLKERPWGLGLAMLAAAVVAAVPETTYIHEQRSTGLWNLVKIGPVIGGHTSVVLLVLAPAGAWALLAWFCALGPRARWMFLCAFGAFAAAQTATPLCWQRYIEPHLLMLLALSAAAVGPVAPAGACRGVERVIRAAAPAARVAGPLVLAALFATLTARTIWNAEPPWNTEIGPDGRRRVVDGVLAIPGKPLETQGPGSAQEPPG